MSLMAVASAVARRFFGPGGGGFQLGKGIWFLAARNFLGIDDDPTQVLGRRRGRRFAACNTSQREHHNSPAMAGPACYEGHQSSGRYLKQQWHTKRAFLGARQTGQATANGDYSVRSSLSTPVPPRLAVEMIKSS